MPRNRSTPNDARPVRAEVLVEQELENLLGERLPERGVVERRGQASTRRVRERHDVAGGLRDGRADSA